MKEFNVYFACEFLGVNIDPYKFSTLEVKGNNIIAVTASRQVRELVESVVYEMTDKELQAVKAAWSKDQEKDITWANRQPCDIVITRHTGLVEYLIEKGIVDENVRVETHASPELVKNKHVIGVLPHSLSCLCDTFSEVPLNLTPELRGKELTKDDVSSVAGELVTYRVKKVKYDSYYQSF